MKTETMSLATYLGYNFVRVKSDNKDYPYHNYPAVVDFYDFNDAKEFAEKLNCKVVLLTKTKDDAHYTINGVVNNGIEVKQYFDPDRYVCYTKSEADEFEKFALGYIKDLICMGTDISFIAELSDKMNDIYDDITTNCSDDFVAIIDKKKWEVFDTLLQYETHFIHNDIEYRIAVIDTETDEDVVKANEQ